MIDQLIVSPGTSTMSMASCVDWLDCTRRAGILWVEV